MIGPGKTALLASSATAGRVMALSMLAAVALWSCAATKPAEMQSRTIEVEGTQRTYMLYASPGCRAKSASCPVLLGFHGGGVRGVSGAQFARSGDFLNAAEHRNVVLVFPDAIDLNWNDGRPGIGSGVDDVGFVLALIRQVATDVPSADTKRIYATGISNGGHMSFRLACEMPDKVKAIAPVAATLSVELNKNCKPDQPVSVLNILGEQDPISPYGGGSIKGGRGEVLSAGQTFAFWQRANRCQDIAQVGSDGPLTTRVLDRCGGQSRTVQISLADGGHTWPGHPGARFMTRLVGNTSMAINATAKILDFFDIGLEESNTGKI